MEDEFVAEKIGMKLLKSNTGLLEPDLAEDLWWLFTIIGEQWEFKKAKALGQKSSWLEFVTLRCGQEPSYLAEYANARAVALALGAGHFATGCRALLEGPDAPPQNRPDDWTRLDHAKHYVANEFVKLRVVAGGFREFGGVHHAYNYNGFVRGSRYNRVKRVRSITSPFPNP